MSDDILSQLAAGQRLLLDGGIGSELQRRGLNLAKGVRSEYETGPWSATAMGDAPEVVRAVHEDYLRVGVDIVTTNSFWTNRPMLDMVGLAEKMESYTRLAVQLARDARDRFNPAAFVAGSMCPPRYGDLGLEFADQSQVIAESGADLLLLELVGSTAEAQAAIDAVSKIDLPVFLGIPVTNHATIRTGLGEDTHETVESLVQALKGRRVDAILPMCSTPQQITAALPKLIEAFDGAVGAYANIGYKHTRKPVKFPERQYVYIDTGENTPARYAECCREWLDMGATIIGGCCATTPEHIGALRPLVTGVTV